jgi:DNA-binding NarL/FixJ family response regulator
VHRAEILQLHGAWQDALDEARRAAGRVTRAAGQAAYRRGELHRLRGEVAQAEDAYREANRHGAEPQPGLALLRLAQGNVDAALAAMGRALSEVSDPVARIRLLPAAVEIMLAAGEHDEARRACEELAQLEPRFTSALLAALAAGARGALDLADGDARAALAALRRAERAWDDIGAPYERARVRVLIGLACRALGDADSAALELEAAHEAFVELKAAPDAARVDGLLRTSRETVHGLSPRELEVLRLVAAGETNKAIAATLVLSERTVDRHVSNIFAKLGISSRTAAAAYAFRHELV